MGLRKLAFIDLETTGLDPSVHEIIEAAVVYEDGSFVEFKVKPEHIETAHPKALEVNGYNEEEWKDAITQQEAAVRIAAAINEFVSAGQSVKFDIGFLDALSKKTGVKIETRYGIDVVTLSYEHLKPLGLRSLSLKDVCKFIGIPPEPEVHRSLNGAKTARSVYFKLLRASALQRFLWALAAKLPTNTQRHLVRVPISLILVTLVGLRVFEVMPTFPAIMTVLAGACYLGHLLDQVLPLRFEEPAQ